jgi:hypothetical protein
MTLTRRRRFITVIFSLCALLFTQVALAAYACPGVAQAVEVAEMANAGMPCAQEMASDMMDSEQPGLCHAHCQAERQSADVYQLPVLATSAELGAVLTLAPITEPSAPAVYAPLALRHGTGPPLSVRNCCFRI